MTQTPTTTPPDVELAPSYVLPIAIVLGALPLGLVSPQAGGVVGVFGLFLIVQAAIIRLRFTAIALDVYRAGKQIRTFPYAEWQNWRVFWPGLPILFYFREVNSIHFLPMLFNPEQLRRCLDPLPRVD